MTLGRTLNSLFHVARRYRPASYVVTFPDGRSTTLDKEGRHWTVDRLDEGDGSTALYETCREAKQSLADAGCTITRKRIGR